MPTYWTVSVPASGNKADAYNILKAKLHDHADVSQFPVPEFKVGTLDSLVVISDELVKHDTAAENTVNKIVDAIRILLGNDVDQIKSNLSVSEKSVESYVKSFQWNTMKYRTDKSLSETADTITREITSIENLMKFKMASYNQLKGNLTNLERKQTGNLSVRSLNDIVKKEHVVQGSEYLTTLVVAVKRQDEKRWLDTYEKGICHEMVVPRSSLKIAEDSEFALFTVTVFRKITEEFKNRCREERFVVRDFMFDEEQVAASKREMQAMGASEKEMWTTILRLAKTNFGEAFACWLHIKALRVFVESVLRYGLPPDFLSVTIKPHPKQERKVKQVLNADYGKVGGSLAENPANVGIKEEGLEAYESLLDSNYLAFVFFPFHWEIERRI